MNNIKTWLNHSQSITDRLKAVSGDARLKILRHEWEPADAFDSARFNINRHESTLHREILMYSRQVACWYARTIIPQATYHKYDDFFDQLKTKPLGDLIYHHNKLKREMTSFEVNPDDLEYQYLPPILESHVPHETLWARLSRFNMADDLPFYLLEIFLPALNQYSAT